VTTALTPFDRLKTFARVHAGRFASVAIGLVYVFVMVLFSQRRHYYELDRDEGFNLIKALLVGRGHPLYAETWSDQPPGYTYLLLAFTRLFGETPETARVLTILFVGALLAAIYELCRRSFSSVSGHVAGLGAVFALLLSTAFVASSTAVMIGLPSIAFSALAWLALSVARQRPAWLAAAGALFACSLAVKLFTLPLIVIFAIAVLLDPAADGRAPRGPASRYAFFAAGFFVVLLLVFGPVLFSGGADSLYASHVGARARMGSRSSLFGIFLADWPLYVAALLGSGLGLWRRSLTAAFALAWLLVAAVSLALHAPLWSHHRFLLAVPASVGFGILLGELLKLTLEASERGVRVAAAALGLLASCAVVASANFDKIAATFRPKISRGALAVEQAVRKHAPSARLMVASRQMYAYRLGLAVPPALSVTSLKRFASSQLSIPELRAIVKEANADVIVLDSRWPLRARNEIEGDIAGKYRRVHADPRMLGVKVFVRAQGGDGAATPAPPKAKAKRRRKRSTSR
jgi:4-amino-4-deoxy-L-arabinose transferase-like glycosyltransferase